MGRSFIDLATLLYSLLSYKFPWISVFSTACFFSERVLIPFVVVLHYTGRTRHFIFVFASLGGLHVEHFKRRVQPHGYGAGTLGSFIVFSLSLRTAVHIERAWHATRPCLHACSCLPGLALSASRTCWEAAAITTYAHLVCQHYVLLRIGNRTNWTQPRSSRDLACGGWLSDSFFCLRKSKSEVSLAVGLFLLNALRGIVGSSPTLRDWFPWTLFIEWRE